MPALRTATLLVLGLSLAATALVSTPAAASGDEVGWCVTNVPAGTRDCSLCFALPLDVPNTQHRCGEIIIH